MIATGRFDDNADDNGAYRLVSRVLGTTYSHWIETAGQA
jgi:hypothetical protein